MKIDPADIFAIYDLVFLAVVFAAWLSFSSWRRFVGDSRPALQCRYCGARVHPGTALYRARCARCGGLNEVAAMKEEE